MTIGTFPKPLHITLLLIALTVVSAAANLILGLNPEPPALTTMGLEAEQDLLMPPMVINSTDDTGPTPTPPPAGGRQFYVSPQGRPNGDGSQTNPWNIWKAIVTPGVVPAGSTVYLRGGTYSMDPNPQPDRVLWEIAGTAVQPIIVRNYPGERAIIDLDWLVEFSGNYVHYWGLEFITSRTEKTFAGGWANGIPGAISFAGKGNKLINCVLHDAHGASLFKVASDMEMYGNIMYYHGLIAQERSWGTTAYVQNSVGYKKIYDNIMFQQFNHNLQIYGSDAATLKDISMVGNTLFSAGTLGTNPGWNAVVWVGAIPAERITFSDNYVYAPPLPDITWTTPNVIMWGSRESTNTDLVFTGNRIVRGYPPVRLARWSPATFTDNTIVGEAGNILAAGIVGLDITLVPNGQYNWNNNRYHQGAAGYQFQYPGGYYDFAGWKVVTGLDTNSTYSASRPTGMDISVRPNQYEQGRAHITILNWDNVATANVNLSTAGLTNGQQYQIKDAQNFFGPSIYSGTYSSSSPTITITLPGAGSPVSPIIGANNPWNFGGSPGGNPYIDRNGAPLRLKLPVHTAIEFNAFVLLPR